jgi:hypothetical protein
MIPIFVIKSLLTLLLFDPNFLHKEEFINPQPKDFIYSQSKEFIDLQSEELSILQPNHKKNEETQEQNISFTLIVKKVDGKLLPGKWLTLNVSTFKKFAIQVQKVIGTIMGVDDIDQEEYTLAFKSAKSNCGSLELSDSKDFEKFRDEYEKLLRLQKEIVMIAQMRPKVNKKKK